jgi:hypothetical protein
LAALYVAGLLIAATLSTPRRVGDGGEYFAMTMRLASLQPPAVTREELAGLRAEIAKLGQGFDSALLEYPNLVGRDGRQDFLHFFLYPLFVAPMWRVAALFGWHPNWAFTVTNVGLLGLAAFLVLRRVPAAVWLGAFLSPIVWWIDKAHTEAFLFAAVAVAAATFDRNPTIALIAYALAGAQNVAVGMTYPVFALLLWYSARREAAGAAAPSRAMTWRVAIPAAAGAALVLSPLVYSWIRLGRVSPMAEYAEAALPTLGGLAGFVFEPNIGLLPSAPAFGLVGLAVLWLLLPTRWRGVARGPTTLWWWPLMIQLMLLVIWSQNPNANHGGTPGVNRWVLTLLALGLPLAAAGWLSIGLSARTTVSLLAIAAAIWSVSSHLPSRPENYLQPTRLARWMWQSGWLQLTPAEVFAERTQRREPATVPSHDGECRVLLIAGQQQPIECVPYSDALPLHCRRAGSMCYAFVVPDRRHVIAAPNNGFFHVSAAPSWPASGPLAAGVRELLIGIDPTAQVWQPGDPRPWRDRLRGADVDVTLRHGRSTFVYIPRTNEVSPPFESSDSARVYSLIPVAPLAALPPRASNLAIVIQ